MHNALVRIRTFRINAEMLEQTFLLSLLLVSLVLPFFLPIETRRSYGILPQIEEASIVSYSVRSPIFTGGCMYIKLKWFSPSKFTEEYDVRFSFKEEQGSEVVYYQNIVPGIPTTLWPREHEETYKITIPSTLAIDRYEADYQETRKPITVYKVSLSLVGIEQGDVISIRDSEGLPFEARVVVFTSAMLDRFVTASAMILFIVPLIVFVIARGKRNRGITFLRFALYFSFFLLVVASQLFLSFLIEPYLSRITFTSVALLLALCLLYAKPTEKEKTWTNDFYTRFLVHIVFLIGLVGIHSVGFLMLPASHGDESLHLGIINRILEGNPFKDPFFAGMRTWYLPGYHFGNVALSFLTGFDVVSILIYSPILTFALLFISLFSLGAIMVDKSFGALLAFLGIFLNYAVRPYAFSSLPRAVLFWIPLAILCFCLSERNKKWSIMCACIMVVQFFYSLYMFLPLLLAVVIDIVYRAVREHKLDLLNILALLPSLVSMLLWFLLTINTMKNQISFSFFASTSNDFNVLGFLFPISNIWPYIILPITFFAGLVITALRWNRFDRFMTFLFLSSLAFRLNYLFYPVIGQTFAVHNIQLFADLLFAYFSAVTLHRFLKYSSKLLLSSKEVVNKLDKIFNHLTGSKSEPAQKGLSWMLFIILVLAFSIGVYDTFQENLGETKLRAFYYPEPSLQTTLEWIKKNTRLESIILAPPELSGYSIGPFTGRYIVTIANLAYANPNLDIQSQTREGLEVFNSTNYTLISGVLKKYNVDYVVYTWGVENPFKDSPEVFTEEFYNRQFAIYKINKTALGQKVPSVFNAGDHYDDISFNRIIKDGSWSPPYSIGNVTVRSISSKNHGNHDLPLTAPITLTLPENQDVNLSITYMSQSETQLWMDYLDGGSNLDELLLTLPNTTGIFATTYFGITRVSLKLANDFDPRVPEKQVVLRFSQREGFVLDKIIWRTV